MTTQYFQHQASTCNPTKLMKCFSSELSHRISPVCPQQPTSFVSIPSTTTAKLWTLAPLISYITGSYYSPTANVSIVDNCRTDTAAYHFQTHFAQWDKDTHMGGRNMSGCTSWGNERLDSNGYKHWRVTDVSLFTQDSRAVLMSIYLLMLHFKIWFKFICIFLLKIRPTSLHLVDHQHP